MVYFKKQLGAPRNLEEIKYSRKCKGPEKAVWATAIETAKIPV